MKKLLILILVVAIFASSCGITGQNTSSLSSMLSSIPSEKVTGSILWFYDMEKIKDLSGISSDSEWFSHPTAEELEKREVFFSGWTESYFSGREQQELWLDTFGYNSFLGVTQEMWAQRVSPQSGSSFSVMRGNFDENNINEKLTGLGYKLKNYASTEYYSIREDNKIDLSSSQAAHIALAFLNRMVVKEHEIIAAPADDILFSILDVRSSREKSLADSLAYTRVAEALGDVLGAALIPQSVLTSKNTDAGWGSLHPYDLAGVGYRVEGQDRVLEIVLHYPDKSASQDIDELTRRLSEYQISVGDLKEPRLSRLFDIGQPETITFESTSILQVKLKYKASTSNSLSSIWRYLVDMDDLGFLVVDPSE